VTELWRISFVAAETFLLLWFLGRPLTRLLLDRGNDPFGVVSALVGVCLVTATSWTWVYATGRGVRLLLYGLVAANVVPFALSIKADRPWRSISWRVLGSRLALPFLGAGVFWHYFRDVLGQHALIASMGNADLPVYALMSQHLTDHGFGDPGFIVGANLGFYAETDYFGAFVLPALPRVLADVDPARSLLPLLMLAFMLTVASAATLVRRLGGLGSLSATVLALLGCSSATYFYSMGQGFLAQLFAMALFAQLALVAETVLRSSSTRQLVRPLALASTLLAGLLCTYPHMAFLSLPVVLGVAAVVNLLCRTGWRPVVNLAGVLGIALVVAGLLLWPRTHIAIQKTFAAEGTPAGWILPRVQLSQILGLQAYPNAPGTVSRVPDHAAAIGAISWRLVASVAALGIGVVLSVLMALRQLDDVQRRSAAWGVALFAVPTTSYFAFYGYFGPSYQQWKWLVFFQPSIVVGTALFLCIIIRAQHVRPLVLGRLPVPILLAVLTVGTLSVPATRHETLLRRETAALHTSGGLRAAGTVNISATTKDTFWDTMWVAYFVAPRRARLETPSYFPTSAPDPGAPTVRATDKGSFEVVPSLNPVP
jgi:hypothetical protein